MVCIRCKIVVRDELRKAGIHRMEVELGEVEIFEQISAEQLEIFRAALLNSGFELMDEKNCALIQKIKEVIVELVHNSEQPLMKNLSVYLSQRLHLDYNHLSNLFSEVQGMTLEQYFIAQKIERVKELLVYNELTLTQIANKMNYSSVGHLSTQFKKVTGLTVSHFMQLKEIRQSILSPSHVF